MDTRRTHAIAHAPHAIVFVAQTIVHASFPEWYGPRVRVQAARVIVHALFPEREGSGMIVHAAHIDAGGAFSECCDLHVSALAAKWSIAAAGMIVRMSFPEWFGRCFVQ